MVTVLKVQLVVGLLMIASPWIFGYYEVTSARWINVAFGLIVFFTALFGILGRDEEKSSNTNTKQV